MHHTNFYAILNWNGSRILQRKVQPCLKMSLIINILYFFQPSGVPQRSFLLVLASFNFLPHLIWRYNMTETWQTLVAVMLGMKVDLGGEQMKEPCSEHLLFSKMYGLILDLIPCSPVLCNHLTTLSSLTQYLRTSFRFSFLIS